MFFDEFYSTRTSLAPFPGAQGAFAYIFNVPTVTLDGVIAKGIANFPLLYYCRIILVKMKTRIFCQMAYEFLIPDKVIYKVYDCNVQM